MQLVEQKDLAQALQQIWVDAYRRRLASTTAQDCLTFWFHAASPSYVTCHNGRAKRNEPLKAPGQAVVMLEGDDLERLLDAALEQTFPASDPIAVDVTPRETAPPTLNN